MGGCCSGVQQQIRTFAPQAFYIHCYAHCLNLALVDCSKSVSLAWEFFALIQTLYTFISTSKAHSIFIKVQKDRYPDKQVHQLQGLSDTRWACRQSAVHAICTTYDSLLATLEILEEDSDQSKAVEARGLLQQIKCFEFVLSLIVFDKVLSTSRGLSDTLQSVNINLAKAAELASATTKALEEYRSNDYWKKVYGYAVMVSKHHNIDVELRKKSKRQCRLPGRLSDGLVCTPVGHRTSSGDVVSNCSDSTGEHFKITLFYPVLDAFILELNKRFSFENIQIMKAIQACNPKSDEFLNSDKLQGIAHKYNIDKEAMEEETTLAKVALKDKTMENIGDVLRELAPLKLAFPALIKIVQIAMTIGVTTAKCERCFSALKLIKTYRRSTMNESRLNDIAILSIEKDLAKELDLNMVVNNFSSAEKNRRIALY